MSAHGDKLLRREAVGRDATGTDAMQSARSGMALSCSARVWMSRGLASLEFLVWHVDPRPLSLSIPLVRLGSL